MRQAGQQPGFTWHAWRGLLAAMLGLMLVVGAAGRAHAAVPGMPIAQPDLAAQSAQFEEPLVPTAETSPEEDAALAAAITRYRHAPAEDDFSALEEFVASHPASGWRLAVLTDLGLSYYHFGYFSKAIDAFAQAWAAGESATEPHAKALADRAAGELLRMHARLGHAETLATLLDQMAGRGLSGRASEWRDGAREGLWMMRNRPGVAYLCGPMALENLLLAGGATRDEVSFLNSYRSGPHGVTLAEVARLATQAKLSYRLIRRAPGDPVPVPAIVHWKVNHFAAIIGLHNDRYELADPTFGEPHMWVTRAALDAEASGYFLVPGGQQSARWQDVSAAEAERVYGMGYANNNDPSQTQMSAATCQTSPAGSMSSATSGCSGSNPQPPPPPMTTYSFAEMLVSLRLMDTPVGYAPPIGPPVRVQLVYNQREASQPANFSFFNVSPKWSLNWLSWIQDDPSNLPGSPWRVEAGGGYVIECFNTTVNECGSGNIGQFAPEINDGSVLSYSASGPSYTLTHPDGSKEVYGLSNGGTGSTRLIFLTQRIDRFGNAVVLCYNNTCNTNSPIASPVLTSIIDATGRVTKFIYGLPNSPLLVTQITDPFGRSAILGYDGSGRLQQITDVLGLTSTFAYDASSLVDRLTTPYGTTNFSYGGGPPVTNSRYLQATDPLGHTERVEFVQGLSQILPSDPSSTVPPGIVAPYNEYLNDRDTFYWDKHAYAVATENYLMARNRHWAHLTGANGMLELTTSNMLESVKYPLENRIWYNYPGQSTAGAGAGQSGTLNKPTNIARILDDGTQQLTQLQYNALGNPTSIVDPVGRTTMLQYAPNQVDVTGVLQATGSGAVTIAGFTYTEQHEPQTYTDAAGQTTHYTYNAAGQIATVTDALGDTTRFNYDPLGDLVSIVNANGRTAASFTYDPFDRVATFTDSEGWTVGYLYDAGDRLMTETFPDSTTRVYTYSNLDLASFKDRQNRTTYYYHDAVRDLTAIKDPLGQITQIGYYENGVPKTLTDPNGNVTTWTIDVESRVVGKTYANGTTFANTYEATTSRLHAVTDPLGQTKQYSYLQDDRLSGIRYLGAINPTPSVAFGYDPYFPRVTAMADGSGTTTYWYNPPGVLGALRLSLESPPFANSDIAYTYDALGRLNGRSVGGDAETVQYDAIGRVITHADDLGTFQRGYLGQTRQLTIQRSGLVGTRWTYDTNLNDRRLTGILNSPAASHFGYTTTPEYDFSAIAESRNQQLWCYTYDPADRLTAVSSISGCPQPPPSDVYQYAYDAASNLTAIQRPSGTTQVTPNSLNQVSSAGGVAFTYDANGNLLSDYARTYAWDAENRLIGVGGTANGAPYVSTFSYDGLSRRIAITTTTGGITGAMHYGWCGQTLCQARTGTDIPSRRYLAEGEASASGALYYSVDQLGSVRDVIAMPSGLKTNHFDYEPYGNPTTSLGSRLTWTDFRYAGLFYHQQSGLYLATYRAYDPVVGGWVSRDRIGEAGGVNLYAYVGGDPIGLRDSLGLWPSWPLDEALPSQASVTAQITKALQKQGLSPAQAAQIANDITNEIGIGDYNAATAMQDVLKNGQLLSSDQQQEVEEFIDRLPVQDRDPLNNLLAKYCPK